MEPVNEVMDNQQEPRDGERANENAKQETDAQDNKRRVYALHQAVENQQRSNLRANDASSGRRPLEQYNKLDSKSSRGTDSTRIKSQERVQLLTKKVDLINIVNGDAIELAPHQKSQLTSNRY